LANIASWIYNPCWSWETKS